MIRLRATMVVSLACALALGPVSAQGQTGWFDISSGGQPTISGSLGGSVIGNPNVTADLQVVVNFGQLSPVNPNRVVKVVIPVAIRSDAPYQVSVTAFSTTIPNHPDAPQLSDIGFGIQNLRRLGKGGRNCDRSQDIRPPYNNDPSQTVDMVNRATYPSTLATLSTSPVILSGARLSNGPSRREDDNGWVFDAILVVAPQYFYPSSFLVWLTFSISSGPNVPCN
jgi:hypothetical protein